MDRLQAMRVFVEVADGGAFAAAGRRLRISPPAITRAVAALEDAIGVRLFTRTTRAVTLTEAGTRYLADCRRILQEIAEAEASAAGLHTDPRGTLVVTAPVIFGRLYILPMLTAFLDRHPALRVEARFVDRIVNLVEDGIDVAVRIGPLPESGLTALRVGSVRRVICGSAGYLARHGVPQTPEDLARHRIIAATNASPGPEWRLGTGRRVAVTPVLSCNDVASAITAACAGWGLTRVLSYQIGPQVACGDLTPVLTEFEGEPLPIHLVHAEGARPAAKVRAFVDFAAPRLRATPHIT